MGVGLSENVAVFDLRISYGTISSTGRVGKCCSFSGR